MKIYENLFKLTEKNDMFYFRDFVSSMHTNVRIFLYRFASYNDWLNEDALECRGIMFEMDDNWDKPIRIMSRPMEKFFNLNETVFTDNKIIDIENNTKEIYLKEDGSLISTYIDKNYLFCKSKGSISSDQALAATRLINSKEYEKLYEICYELAEEFTVNFEYVAPDNQVVVYYDKPELRVLNIRNNITGEYVPYTTYSVWFKDCIDMLCKPVELEVSTLDEIYNMTDIEGFIFVLNSGQRVKLKTKWYLNLHRIKSSVNTRKEVIIAVMNETIDDLLPLMVNNVALRKEVVDIQDFMSKIFIEYYNKIVNYFNENKHKSRKDFAIGAVKEFEGTILMSLAMNLFVGKIPESDLEDALKEVIIKYAKEFSERYEKYIVDPNFDMFCTTI